MVSFFRGSIMNESQGKAPDDFNRCADFHGHVCPGLAIGYRAAKAGLAWLQEHRAPDEELVALVETDACGVDAVQVLTGCTFGKGNLVYKDYGKQVYTFLGRRTGKGVRVALKDGAVEMSDAHRNLMQKIREDTATEAERETFWANHRKASYDVLEKPLEDLFTVQASDTRLPGKAKIEPSVLCSVCGEPTMRSKMVEVSGRNLCRECAEKARG